MFTTCRKFAAHLRSVVYFWYRMLYSKSVYLFPTVSVTVCSAVDTCIPLLWAALEVVSHRVYTIKSDVWSFAVLMVEMFLYGERPYPGIDLYCTSLLMTRSIVT